MTQPYRFERTLIFLAIVVLALIVGTVSAVLAAKGSLTFPSPRSWHLIYLATLLTLAFALLSRPRLSSIVLCLATLEVIAGIGTALSHKVGLTHASLFPGVDDRDSFGSRFKWHPLLQAVPIPNADLAGGRVHHNSLGMRGAERSAKSLQGKVVVAVFGGSSTYDVAVDDGQTWPEHLETILGDRYAVVNYGVPGYTTVEAVIQTAFYGFPQNVRPTCAVYYQGWNDVRNSHLSQLDPAYADFHLPSQVDTDGSRRLSGPNLLISPLLAISARLLILAFDTVRPVEPDGPISGEPDPRLENFYTRNVETISAINRQRGVKTIWIGQVMDPSRLTASEPDRWVVLVPPRRTLALVQRLNGILEQSAKRLGDMYVFPEVPFAPHDFADMGHFSAAGTIKFATAIANTMANNCR